MEEKLKEGEAIERQEREWVEKEREWVEKEKGAKITKKERLWVKVEEGRRKLRRWIEEAQRVLDSDEDM